MTPEKSSNQDDFHKRPLPCMGCPDPGTYLASYAPGSLPHCTAIRQYSGKPVRCCTSMGNRTTSYISRSFADTICTNQHLPTAIMCTDVC